MQNVIDPRIINRLEERFDRLRDSLGPLQEAAEMKALHGRLLLQDRIGKLRQGYEANRGRLDRLREVSADAWERSRAELERTLGELETVARDARAELERDPGRDPQHDKDSRCAD